MESVSPTPENDINEAASADKAPSDEPKEVVVKLIRYSREELLAMQHRPECRLRPKLDIEADCTILRRDTADEDQKRRKDPRERAKRENDGIVLSPQRGANFKQGCSVPIAPLQPSTPQQPQQRRIGSGRLLTREWEQSDENFNSRQQGAKTEWGRDRKKFNTFGNESDVRNRPGKQPNGGPRDGELVRPDAKNQRQPKNPNGNFPARRQTDDKKNNRNIAAAPEWFTEGPTSRNDRIDLHGFDDVPQENENPKLADTEEAANPAEAKPKGEIPEKPAETAAKQMNLPDANVEYFLNDFMTANPLAPMLSDMKQDHSDGPVKKAQSRFTQFFSANEAQNEAQGSDVGAAFISAWCKDQPDMAQPVKIPDIETFKMQSVMELEAHVLMNSRQPNHDDGLPAEFVPRALRNLDDGRNRFPMGQPGMHHDPAIMAHLEEDSPMMHRPFMHPPMRGMPMMVPHPMDREHFMNQQPMHPNDGPISEEEQAARLFGMMPHVNPIPNVDEDIHAKMAGIVNMMQNFPLPNEDVGQAMNNPGRSVTPGMFDDENMAAKFPERPHFPPHGQPPPPPPHMMAPKNFNPPQTNPLRLTLLFSPQFVESMSTLPPDLRFMIAQAYPSAEMLSRPEFVGIVAGVQHGNICPSHLVNIFAKTHHLMPPRQRETLTAALHYIWAVHRGASPMNNVPNRGHLVAHTANIMQNALIKKKLEEQAENFKKRQDGELAFTPTAVLRKMTNAGPFGPEMVQLSPINDLSPQHFSGRSSPDPSNQMASGQFSHQGHMSPSNMAPFPAMHMQPNFRPFPPPAFAGQFGPPHPGAPDAHWWNQDGMGRVVPLPPGLPIPRAPLGRPNAMAAETMSMITVEELERNQQGFNDGEEGVRGGHYQ